MVKRAPQGIVAIAFTHDDFVNANQNDIVQLTSDFHVTHCTNARPLGKVIAIDKYTLNVTVELFGYSQTVDQIVGATPVVAGNRLKSSAQNTVVPASPETTPADIAVTWGLALSSGAVGAVITVLPIL